MEITILLHERQPRVGGPGHYIWALCDVWREQGHQIEVVRGVKSPSTGDIVFLHVDATVVPQEYLDAVAGHPRVLNRRVVDISKTSFSRHVVRSPEEWDGPVIVKTVRKTGGHPERVLARTTLRGRFRDAWDACRRRSLARARWLDPSNYPIFQSTRDVPAGVWRNRALFVERFMPERSGGLYLMRSCMFLGDRGVTTLCKSEHPIVKSHHILSKEDIPGDDAVEAARRRMGFDYGKFDYAIHDGELVIFDANRTTGLQGPVSERLRRITEFLAQGIHSFFQ